MVYVENSKSTRLTKPQICKNDGEKRHKRNAFFYDINRRQSKEMQIGSPWKMEYAIRRASVYCVAFRSFRDVIYEFIITVSFLLVLSCIKSTCPISGNFTTWYKLTVYKWRWNDGRRIKASVAAGDHSGNLCAFTFCIKILAVGIRTDTCLITELSATHLRMAARCGRAC